MPRMSSLFPLSRRARLNPPPILPSRRVDRLPILPSRSLRRSRVLAPQLAMGYSRFRGCRARTNDLVPRRFLGRNAHQRELSRSRLDVRKVKAANAVFPIGLARMDSYRPTYPSRHSAATWRPHRRHLPCPVRLYLRSQSDPRDPTNGLVLLLPQMVRRLSLRFSSSLKC
jgi:hypothetical protein